MKATIIISTYNERDNLQKLVEKIIALDLNSRLEIVIVDDNSPDGTGRIADELGKRSHLNYGC
jgi:dolichol-phosphate mannosyltransferase